MKDLHPSWFDPRMPDRRRCVLGELLQSAQDECPDRIFAVFENDQVWTYSDLYHNVRQRAAALQKLGVKRHDRVLVWLPNGPDMILTWFATNFLGACFVPINTAYVGDLLAHVIRNSGARLLVAHGALIDRLQDVATGQIETIVAIGGTPSVELPGLRLEDRVVLDASPDRDFKPEGSLMPWDLQSIIYTSGTTGPSKGVLSSYFHLYTCAGAAFGYANSEDRIFVNGPMFHVGGTGAVYAALINRASVAVVEGFSARRFWEQIKRTKSTMTSGLLGSMAVFLAKTGEDMEDTSNPLRRTHFYPISDTTIGLTEKFSFEYFSGFGMTEMPLILVTDLNARVKGSCGKPRTGVEVRLVDENDCEVPDGEVGELIARTDYPWSFMSGYNGMPEATLNTIRNGWYHTGDLFRKDTQGNFFFVDRAKDAIRRRGENISSQEVEGVVCGYPAVKEAAAFGVPGAYGEDEVMVVVTEKQGQTVEPIELMAYLTNHLSTFMLPRYVRIKESLPKTPTDKVQKNVLRDEGVTKDTWDRDRAGIVVKKTRLV